MVSNVKQGKYWINNNNNDADTVFRPLKFIYLERGVVREKLITLSFSHFFPCGVESGIAYGVFS